MFVFRGWKKTYLMLILFFLLHGAVVNFGSVERGEGTIYRE